MSKKNKKQSREGNSREPVVRSGGGSVALREETEPVAENHAVPVLLIALLVTLLFWADLYVMNHGGNLGGRGGAFSARIYHPFKSYADVERANPDAGGSALGESVYARNCSICHQPTGMGIPGQFPPLAKSDWVLEEGPNRIIRLILNGVQGPIVVNGQPFNNSMVPWRDTLSDKDIAAVATYIRNTWGNKASPVTPEQVKAIRDETAGRSTAYSPTDLLALPTK